MVAIGDKVVYPMHGAGVIEAIEEHEVLGATQKYYVFTMPDREMKVMIPMNNVEHVGLRSVINDQEVSEVLAVLQDLPQDDSGNWNRRFNRNLAKIKSGNICEVAEVVRNLMRQDNLKKLSTGERRLLDTAKHILISELMLACDKDAGSCEKWVETLIQQPRTAEL